MERREHAGMKPRSVQTELVVVGGGIAVGDGTATCFLAREGTEVTLFEKAPNVGGRAATRDSGGFLLNRGIHALYTGGAASQTLEELGVSDGHGTPQETFVLDDRELRPFPISPARFLRSALLGEGDKMALVRFFAGLGRARPRDLAGPASKSGWTRRSTVRACGGWWTRWLTPGLHLRARSGERRGFRGQVPAGAKAPRTLR